VTADVPPLATSKFLYKCLPHHFYRGCSQLCKNGSIKEGSSVLFHLIKSSPAKLLSSQACRYQEELACVGSLVLCSTVFRLVPAVCLRAFVLLLCAALCKSIVILCLTSISAHYTPLNTTFASVHHYSASACRSAPRDTVKNAQSVD
jgi:hypothetical protein